MAIAATDLTHNKDSEACSPPTPRPLPVCAQDCRTTTTAVYLPRRGGAVAMMKRQHPTQRKSCHKSCRACAASHETLRDSLGVDVACGRMLRRIAAPDARDGSLGTSNRHVSERAAKPRKKV